MVKYGHSTLYTLLCTLFVCINLHVAAQTRADLELKKQTLQAEISQLQKQLTTTSKNKTTTKAEVELLKKQIASREALINNYNEELNQLTKDIKGSEQVQNSLQQQLDADKRSYASLVQFNYRHSRDASPPLYLLSKDNMQAAVLQHLYATRIHACESNQILDIYSRKTTLGKVVQSLKEQHDAKLKVLAEQQQQKQRLTADKQLRDVKYKELETTEKNLRSKLLTKKADAAKLNKQIEAIIRKEIEAARAKAKAEALAKEKAVKVASNSKTTTETKATAEKVLKTPALTSDMMKLAGSFEANKGRFPWPAHGSLVETFGTHPHPEVKDVVINNNGIDIGMAEGGNVQTIYEGTVVAVFANAGYQNAVLVQHGDYYTVYANLGSVAVSKGDKVKARQQLGTVYTQPDTHKSILHFEIWKGTTKLNPQLWLGN